MHTRRCAGGLPGALERKRTWYITLRMAGAPARSAGSARLLSLWPFAVLLLLLLHLGHHLLEPRLAAEVLEHLRVHLVHHLRHGGGVHVVQILPRLAHLFVLLYGLLHR